MKKLSEQFWSDRYASESTGWDLGAVSPPIKAYVDQLEDKSMAILIPGCGNAYEAEYLHQQGFTNVHLLDLSQLPLDAFANRVADFPKEHIHCGDFFTHTGTYDLIIEQTLFCAIDPTLRGEYAKATHRLLRPGGKLVGVLFDTDFPDGPPYGGCKEEYMTYFEELFTHVSMEKCHNSVGPRQGNELFIKLVK